jgi:hypothetical protein
MRIAFYRLAAGEFGWPALTEVPGGQFEIPPGTPPLDRRGYLERFFKTVVDGEPALPPLLAISSTIGEFPGAVVGVEIVSDDPRSGRRIAWVYRPTDELFAEGSRDDG